MSGVKIDIGPTGRRVAGNIESTRRAAKLSLIEMSKRLNEIARPLSANSLAGIEAGERRVDVEDLLCIADVLGVTVARLLGDESVREDEPARPVEDREPVGPYAPTRTPNLDDRAAAAPEQFESGYRQGWRERHVYGTPRYKGLPTLTNRPEGGTELGDYLVEQFGSVGTRIDGLVDVVLGIGRQMTDNRVWESERFDRIDTALAKLTDLFVDSRDEIERIKASAECTIDHSSEPVQMVQFKEAFERGRQQGDADRAQRLERTDEARAVAHARERNEARQQGFDNGVAIGKSEREAELLDQGWTPPGAITALEVTSGPTDYEVWRDAVMGACTLHADMKQAATAGAATRQKTVLQADAEALWELLQQVPVRTHDDAAEYVCEACGDEFPTADELAAHEDEKHAANGQ